MHKMFVSYLNRSDTCLSGVCLSLRGKMKLGFNDARHSKSSNQQFAVELTKWTFHERGHLKVHHPRS